MKKICGSGPACTCGIYSVQDWEHVRLYQHRMEGELLMSQEINDKKDKLIQVMLTKDQIEILQHSLNMTIITIMKLFTQTGDIDSIDTCQCLIALWAILNQAKEDK